MKVFISWSGERSRKLGEAFRTWLPAVLQTAKPYFTPNDIEKGNRWSSDIANELDSSSVGIFCITPENINSPWIMFEAGAISKKVDQSLVCPILFNLSNSDISGPLTQFQTTLFDKRDIKALIKGINSANSEGKLDDEVLNTVFEMWWPKLEEMVNPILEEKELENIDSIRSDRSILEEVLDLSRLLTRSHGKEPKSDVQKKLYGLISSFLASFSLVFDHDWYHTKGCLETDIIDCYIAEGSTFINPSIEDEHNNWSNRGALLESYRELKDFISQNEIDIQTQAYW